MSILRGKNIPLGITAGIAAYKTASLVRLFIKSGAHVKVIMTPSAKEFITPLTLSTLSKNPVISSFTNDDDDNSVWNNHVDLGLWAGKGMYRFSAVSFKKTIKPRLSNDQDYTLAIEAIDDMDVIYVNGNKVGSFACKWRFAMSNSFIHQLINTFK